MVALQSSVQRLNVRRKRMGMSYRALAERSGVSEPTVKRVLSGRSPEVAMSTLVAIAKALGVSVSFEEQDIGEMKRRQAERKAEWVARAVQGTSGLEAQGMDERTRREVIERTVNELLAGSARRLWEE